MIAVKKRTQLGLTLVELMVALVLSGMLMLGLANVFGSSSEANRLADGLGRVQENARIGMEMLGRDLRNAAYLGCAGWGSFTDNVDRTKYSSQTGLSAAQVDAIVDMGNPGKTVQVFNDIAAIPAGSDLADYGLVVGTATGNLLAGTDAIILRGAESCEGGKVVQYQGNSANFKIEDAAACNLNQNDIVIVTSCRNADMFAITNNPLSGGGSKDTVTHAANLNTSSKLNGTYGDDDSEIMRFYSKVYYIGTGSSGRPALFLRRLEGLGFVEHELVDGITNMQILAGEDIDAGEGVDRYLEPEDAALDNERIKTLRLTLSVTSDAGVQLDNTPFTQDLQSVFAIRNRVGL